MDGVSTFHLTTRLYLFITPRKYNYFFASTILVLCSLLGLLAFSAPYLPWVLLGFSTLLGHDVSSDLLGIAVGHVYYFFAGA